MHSTLKPSTLKPCGARILCRIILSPLRTDGGIFLPLPAKTNEAVVISVGPDNTQNLRPGDRVLFDNYDGIPIRHDNIDYVLFSPHSLMGVLVNE